MDTEIDPSIRRQMNQSYDIAEKQLFQKPIQQQTSKLPIQEDWRDNVNIFVRDPSKKKGVEDRSKTMRAALAKEKGEKSLPLEGIKATADGFEKGNQELKSKVLQLLRESIKDSDSAEDILKKVLEFYQDVSLADEALDFLLETTSGPLYEKVLAAKEQLNADHGREVRAGRNIADVARGASDQGLGSATSLRNLYRDVTVNPRDSNTLFNELNKMYPYKDMENVINFMLHSVGADLKSKGPSIPPGLLHNLLQETRSLQAILGVYNFFKDRMGLVEKQFSGNDIPMPAELTFEQIAKQFMGLVGDRYPSGDKVLQTAVRLGIDKWILAKIIVLSQLRDSIREVALNQIFRNLQHRDDLFNAIIAALEQLEDELEELLEKQEEEEEEEDEEEEEKEDKDTFDKDEDF